MLDYYDRMTLKYVKPRRIFEGAGTVVPEESYYVPIENVVNKNKQDIRTIIDGGRYFSIFAPRQSGKTTFFTETSNQLHKDPTYIAITLSFQYCMDFSKEEFYAMIQRYLYSQLINRLKEVNCEKTETVEQFLNSHFLTGHNSFILLFEELNRIIQFKKIVIFIDEFDGIPNSQLGNFLTSLRELYLKYKVVKQKALYSVGLVGIRNITKLVVGGISPFNIADQVTLPPFSLENVRQLVGQYTQETNQPFTQGAIKKIHEATAGQPWLVNRLGTILTMEVKPETTTPIEKNDVQQAINLLLKEKNDHFDNLYEKARLYKETFVEIVFDHVEYNPYDEDQNWLEQYGLIKNEKGHAVVANRIYKNIFLNAFFREADAYENLSLKEYLLPGNKLDMKRILLNFEKYISRMGVSAFYQEEKPFEKTGQFLLTAWLYQFVRGERDDLRREVLSGLGRMDIMLTCWGKKYIIELKVNRHDDVTVILNEGILQLSNKYLASENEDEGYLVVFDTKTPVGTACRFQAHSHTTPEGKIVTVTSCIISIGRSSEK